jgi:hypothetical protein
MEKKDTREQFNTRISKEMDSAMRRVKEELGVPLRQQFIQAWDEKYGKYMEKKDE